ncbi:MAG: class I SAM-dependent methyltransferase, partial [Deltaproteobacteria bacterium]
GIYSFASSGFYWNQIPLDEMRELLASARKSGWENGLRKHLKTQVDDYLFNYAVDERRADWFPLCSLNRESTIVDVGAGWGAVSMGLARLGHHLLSIDSNIETLEFITIRAEQEDIKNLCCLHMDPLDLSPLPLHDAVADLVIFNGVLEWVGTAITTGDPQDLQRKALLEAYRVLKPGGELYLAIESRYGLSYWLGSIDHPKTRFTSILPRRLASIYTRSKGLGDYRTYTHSYYGLKSLLREAGFNKETFYAPYPNYRFPKRIIPIDDRMVFVNTIMDLDISRKHKLMLSLVSWFGFHRILVDNYSIVAIK